MTISGVSLDRMNGLVPGHRISRKFGAFERSFGGPSGTIRIGVSIPDDVLLGVEQRSPDRGWFRALTPCGAVTILPAFLRPSPERIRARCAGQEP